MITSAYSFADYEYAIRDLYRTVYNIVLDIEARFEQTIIKEFDPNFYEEKVELASLKELPEVYQRFIDNEDDFLEYILEDPVEWQHGVIEDFNAIKDELNKKRKKFELMKEAIPSTALLRKVRGGQNKIKTAAFGVGSLVISALVTTGIEQKMFITSGITQIDSSFIITICLLFAIIEFLIIFLGRWIYKISLSWAKRKYQSRTIK